MRWMRSGEGRCLRNGGGQEDDWWKTRIISTIGIVLICFFWREQRALLLHASYLFFHSVITIDPLAATNALIKEREKVNSDLASSSPIAGVPQKNVIIENSPE